MTHILVIDGDEDTRTALTRGLAERGHTVSAAATAWEAVRALVDEDPDLILLDLGLRDLDGFELLKMVRVISDVLIVVLAARNGEKEMVELFDAGADDYVVKPFTTNALDARLSAILRRAHRDPGGGGKIFQVGALKVDVTRREAALGTRRIELTRREFDLLAFLVARAGRVVPRAALRDEVWGRLEGDDQTIDVHLSWLRRKLGESAAAPRYLHTVRGVGVKIVDPT